MHTSYPPQADASILGSGLSPDVAPHRFLLGPVSFAQPPPDRSCFVATEIVFQATHSWDLEDCQSHHCCFIFQWLWKKVTAWIECSKLWPWAICSILFQFWFLLLLWELIFLFSGPPFPQPSSLKNGREKKWCTRCLGRGTESRHSNPMRMWNGWKLEDRRQ